MEHRVLEQTVDEADAHLHVHQELIEVGLPDRLLHAPVQRVHLLVELAGQRRPDRLRREPGRADARPHRGSESARDHHLHRLFAFARVAGSPARELHEPHPEVRPRLVSPVERKRDMHAQDSGQVVGALQMAAEQRQRSGGPAKHRRPRNRRPRRPRCPGCRRPASC